MNKGYKRYKAFAMKWKGKIRHGMWIDLYNNSISYDVSGTITTRVSASNEHYVAVMANDKNKS